MNMLLMWFSCMKKEKNCYCSLDLQEMDAESHPISPSDTSSSDTGHFIVKLKWLEYGDRIEQNSRIISQ